jgi:hypothetical protein
MLNVKERVGYLEVEEAYRPIRPRVVVMSAWFGSIRK